MVNQQNFPESRIDDEKVVWSAPVIEVLSVAETANGGFSRNDGSGVPGVS